MFDSVIGQERVKGTLASMLDSSRVPGTLLFAGPYGVGKSEAAFELARLLLCGSGPAAGCETCSACERARKLAHPDLHVLFPFKAKPKSGDTYDSWVESLIEHRELLAREPYAPVVYEKGRFITDDLVEEVRERLLESSLEGGRKVCVILAADRLNRTTGNKLLKILEEPPEDVHFILTTDRLSSMLPTIVSRASIVRFRRLTKDEIITYLSDTGAADRAATLSPAVLDEGSIKTAKAHLFGGNAGLLDRSFALFEAAAGGEDAVVGMAYDFMRSRDPLEAEELINGFAQYTRYIVACKAGTLDRETNYPRGVDRFSGTADFRSLDRLSGLFGKGLGMLGRNVSVSMVLTPILYGIHDTFR